MLPCEELIRRSIYIEGYNTPVAYDESIKSTFGYYICKECNMDFYIKETFHKHLPTCPLFYNDRDANYQKKIIYVLGPNEDGTDSPFGKENIENIKKLASYSFKEEKPH